MSAAIQQIRDYLADPSSLVEESAGKSGDYVHPARKALGSVSIVLLREAIAPVVFRNSEQEITDIEYEGEAYVRAVPNKFKYAERGRGLQVLRAFGLGGRQPQNMTVVPKGCRPSEFFDLNTMVFGDSANHENNVLPVRAAVNYSDALSVLPKYLCVEETFHNRASEDGSLWDAENKKNSDNIFTRHFIRPGTVMVQVLNTRGRVLTPEGMVHLLLSIGLAGAYGGQTAITGTNIRTHFVGIYADRFERAETSPYQLLGSLEGLGNDVPALAGRIDEELRAVHATAVPGVEVGAELESLIERFNANDEALVRDYQQAANQAAELFDAWFAKPKKSARGKGSEARDG